MFSHSTKTASFFSILNAAVIFSLVLSGVAGAQSNTSLRAGIVVSNTTSSNNTASGVNALLATPRAAIIPPSDSLPMFLPGI